MAAVLILLESGDCVADMKMNKYEEEINADYSKTVTAVSKRQIQVGCIVLLEICC
jgi:hypothetical protein